MASAPATQPAPPPADHDNDLLQNTLVGLMRACDIVFGSTSVVLAVVGSWLVATGHVRVLTVVGLWAIPVFNTVWSALTRNRDRVRADLLRGALCLPIATFLYVAEPGGVLQQLWIPALLMAVGIALSTGIASRRTLLGCLVTFSYAGALVAASVVHDRGWEVVGIDDGVGIMLTGCVISLVGSKLGRTLDEARRQRDGAREQKDRAESVLQQLTERSRELTTAIENLHDEMEHRMRVEVELRQAQKLESVGRLAAGVAHEINTPVQFVSDSIQFVRDGVSELFVVVDKLEVVQRSVLEGSPSRAAAAMAADATDIADLPYLAENVPKALDRALEGLGRVATIVRSMKEFAHPDSRDMELADINHAIENTLTMARNEYRGVAEIETDFGDLPPVRCHVGELNQAILNIVINAAHAIADVVQDTEAKGRIRVQTLRDGDDVVITITDTGPGIADDIRGRIFDPFFTTKQVGRGTGQGLAIAHSVIVDKHHGHIGFETELGKGTTFSIRLAIDGCQSASSSDAA